LAADFARGMLSRAGRRFGERAGDRSAPYAVAIEADALHSAVAAGVVDLIVTAFGFRNLAKLRSRPEGVQPGVEAREGSWGFWNFAERKG